MKKSSKQNWTSCMTNGTTWKVIFSFDTYDQGKQGVRVEADPPDQFTTQDCPNRIDTEFVYNDIHALTSSHWNVLSRAWVQLLGERSHDTAS